MRTAQGAACGHGGAGSAAAAAVTPRQRTSVLAADPAALGHVRRPAEAARLRPPLRDGHDTGPDQFQAVEEAGDLLVAADVVGDAPLVAVLLDRRDVVGTGVVAVALHQVAA